MSLDAASCIRNVSLSLCRSFLSPGLSISNLADLKATKPEADLLTAQFGQELLSTFGTQIGEIALIPATGGLFQVELVGCLTALDSRS